MEYVNADFVAGNERTFMLYCCRAGLRVIRNARYANATDRAANINAFIGILGI